MSSGAKRSKPAATAVWVVKRLPARVAASATLKGCARLFHEVAGAFENGECRMPFIQVTHLRFDPERAEQPPSADPEQDFLLEAQFGAAAIEFAGDPPMCGKIRRIITIEEVKLHSADLNLPGAQPDRISRQRDFQPQPLPVRVA